MHILCYSYEKMEMLINDIQPTKNLIIFWIRIILLNSKLIFKSCLDMRTWRMFELNNFALKGVRKLKLKQMHYFTFNMKGYLNKQKNILTKQMGC